MLMFLVQLTNIDEILAMSMLNASDARQIWRLVAKAP